ncbi:MAG: SRPBCC family protein [Acidimicrobiia bacterium]|nr:SRPBCC family protein [Acidimicrobiia bacterium]
MPVSKKSTGVSTDGCQPRRRYIFRMGSVRRHVHIDRDPDSVWKLVGDLARQHEWFPLSSCRVEGNKRWITLPSGITFEEDIITHDHSLRRFQYRMVGNPGINSHLGTCDVLDDGHGGADGFPTALHGGERTGLVGGELRHVDSGSTFRLPAPEHVRK